MSELVELLRVRQRAGEPRRRWFHTGSLDLIVWYDESDAIIGFQFCYDKPRSEHALTWSADSGYSHMAIDDGEMSGRAKTPILVPNGCVDRDRIRDLFSSASGRLPVEICQFVSDRLATIPGESASQLPRQ